MQTAYQRDLKHNYLILQPEAEQEFAGYQLRMLLGNEIPALLACQLQMMNGQRQFYYEITARQALSDVFDKRKLKYEDLQALFRGFLEGVNQMEEYLLDSNQLVVAPQYIYIEENHKVSFCYLPGYDQDIRRQFRSLAEYCLPRIDHQDTQAILLGYGIYRISMEENFSLEQLQERLWRKEEEEKSQEALGVYEAEPQEDVRQEAMREFFEGTDEEPASEKTKIPWETAASSAIWTIVLLGICALRYLGYFSFLTMPMMVGILLIILAVLGINVHVWRKGRKDDRMPKKWLPTETSKEDEKPEIQEEPTVEESNYFGEERKSRWKEIPGQQVQAEEIFREDLPSSREQMGLELTQPLPPLQPQGGVLISQNPDLLPDIILNGDLTLIGKLEGTVDVIIPLPTVSRVHAKIEKSGEDYYLTDMNSSNGTYVNGELISGKESQSLFSGDEIRFADAVYLLEI